jgi:uncharacterized protein YgfB (UPF0149 family)
MYRISVIDDILELTKRQKEIEEKNKDLLKSLKEIEEKVRILKLDTKKR